MSVFANQSLSRKKSDSAKEKVKKIFENTFFESQNNKLFEKSYKVYLELVHLQRVIEKDAQDISIDEEKTLDDILSKPQVKGLIQKYLPKFQRFFQEHHLLPKSRKTMYRPKSRKTMSRQGKNGGSGRKRRSTHRTKIVGGNEEPAFIATTLGAIMYIILFAYYGTELHQSNNQSVTFVNPPGAIIAGLLISFFFSYYVSPILYLCIPDEWKTRIGEWIINTFEGLSDIIGNVRNGVYHNTVELYNAINGFSMRERILLYFAWCTIRPRDVVEVQQVDIEAPVIGVDAAAPSNTCNTEENCPICLNKLNLNISDSLTTLMDDHVNNDGWTYVNIVIQLSCTHCFHKGCIKHWGTVNPICPICRQATLADVLANL